VVLVRFVAGVGFVVVVEVFAGLVSLNFSIVVVVVDRRDLVRSVEVFLLVVIFVAAVVVEVVGVVVGAALLVLWCLLNRPRSVYLICF
jgi:hypothetical protein